MTTNPLHPVRVQRRRERGWRMPPNTVYVGRPSEWGNPYRVGSNCGCPDMPAGPMDAGSVVVHFRDDTVRNRLRTDPTWLWPLRGKNLACWCPLDQPCHADVLLELANR